MFRVGRVHCQRIWLGFISVRAFSGDPAWVQLVALVEALVSGIVMTEDFDSVGGMMTTGLS